MILGVPCYQNHELTRQLVASVGTRVDVVIVDNASPDPYTQGEFDRPVRIIRNDRNEGNFYPLAQVAETGDDEIVALVHNDLILYESGWDQRVEAAFRDDPRLGLIGFAGSTAIGEDGQRAPGTTMSNLRGERGHVSAEGAGVRITDLRPSVAVDGLFMAFRRSVLPFLTLERTMPPAHFYDYIWGAQVIGAGFGIAVLGIDCDHVGWSTEVGQADALEGEWRRWARESGRPVSGKAMSAIWDAGHDHWLRFRGSFWPVG